MDDDWDVDIAPKKSGASTPVAAPAPRAPVRGKWKDEDASEEEEDDWDVSDSEKAKPAPVAAAPAPVRKKKLAEKLAEKERMKDNSVDELIDIRTEQDRARDAKREALERERAADLAVATDLMGDVGVADPKATMEAILTAKPKSKEDFAALSSNIMALLIAKHAENPLYPAFVEGFAKDLSEPLTAVQVRKVGSGLSTLGNTKQAEERDKASGKKKAASKPKLGATKALHSVDTDAYHDALDDDDFM